VVNSYKPPNQPTNPPPGPNLALNSKPPNQPTSPPPPSPCAASSCPPLPSPYQGLGAGQCGTFVVYSAGLCLRCCCRVPPSRRPLKPPPLCGSISRCFLINHLFVHSPRRDTVKEDVRRASPYIFAGVDLLFARRAISHDFVQRQNVGGYFRSTAGFRGLAKAHAATPLLQTILLDNYLESLRMEWRTRPQQKGKKKETNKRQSSPSQVRNTKSGTFVLLRIARFDLLEFHT